VGWNYPPFFYMKGNPKMETRTYLINTVWDYFKKELKQIDGNEVTIQFKIMDKYSMIEIIGIKKSIGEQFKHQIICHKDQTIKILENKNDQVEFDKSPINSNVDRVHFNQSFEPTSTFGLHGQLELFEEELN